MSESESESKPRFNKAIIGRILAVLVFVGLGTFAVIQSIKSKPPAVTEELDSGASDGTDDKGSKKSPTEDSVGKDSSKLASNSPEQANDFSKQSNPTSKSQQIQVNNFAPTAKAFGGVVPKDSKSTNNAFPKTPPATRSFQIGQPNLPVVVAKPQKKPPERFAQAPGGRPMIGSNGGYGTRPAAPKLPSNKIDDSKIDGMLRAGANQATSAENNIKNDVKESANDLLKKTSEQAAAAADTVKKSNINSFNPKPKTSSGLPGPPPAKSFVPPAVQSNFGGRSPSPKNTGASDPASLTQKSSRTPDNSSFINSRNLAPVTPAKSGRSNFGSNSGSSQSLTQGVSSRQKPANQSSASGSTSSPFGNLNVTSSSRSSSPTAPLRTPPPPNPRSTQSTTFPKSQIPVNNNRPTSRLTTNSTILPSASTDLAQPIPGDRQLEGIQAAAVTIEKLSPREIQVDQPADFQMVIRNVGRADAEDVRVFDKIPSGTEFQGASPEPTNRSRNGDIQWHIGKLRSGQEKRIKLQLKPTRPGEIGSVAHVTFSTQASMRTLVTKPVLEIVHQSKPTHLIGDDVILDVIVKNKGDGPAKNVLIQEDVPKQLEFQDGYRELEYEIGTLMPGQSRRVQLSLKAAQVGKLRNVMFASAAGGLQAKHELPMEVVAPKLVVRTDGPTRRFLQRNATHQLSVANNGTAPATNVELIARLPSGLRFLSANNQGRYDASAHSVYWSLAELARGIEANVELKTMPVEVGNQPIKFESFADLKVKANAEQALSVEHLVDVFFDIDDVIDPIEIGSKTSYRVRIVNQGTKAATNVQLQVDFPPGLQPTSVDGSLRHNINGQRIAFEPINSLTPGDEISIVIHGKGQSAGDHRVVVNMRADGRQTPVSKEETTRVYSDR